MGLENSLGYMLSSLLTQLKFAKEYIFTAALQKDKSNPVVGVDIHDFKNSWPG